MVRGRVASCRFHAMFFKTPNLNFSFYWVIKTAVTAGANRRGVEGLVWGAILKYCLMINFYLFTLYFSNLALDLT